MIQLSIVVPKSDCAAQFEGTLASVLGNRPENCEVIVATAGPYDDPYDLADEVEFVEAAPESGLLDLVNLGFQQARGEIVHLLLCGVEVQEGWTRPAVLHFSDPSVGSVSPLVMSSRNATCVAAAGVHTGLGLTRKLAAAGKVLREDQPLEARISGPTLTAAFYRKTAIARVQGVDPATGAALADLDLALSLGALGYLARVEPASRVYGQPASPGSSRFGEGASLERLFWKHCRSAASVPWHAVEVAVEFLSRLRRGGAAATFAGRLWGMLLAPLDRHRSSRSASPWPAEAVPGAIIREDPPHLPQRVRAKSRKAVEHPAA